MPDGESIQVAFVGHLIKPNINAALLCTITNQKYELVFLSLRWSLKCFHSVGASFAYHTPGFHKYSYATACFKIPLQPEPTK